MPVTAKLKYREILSNKLTKKETKLMAGKKDVLREIMAEQSKTKVLDRKWRTRQPVKADFDLEGTDIPTFCAKRQHFYNDKEKQADEISRNIPDPKAKVMMDFGWEGWSMLALCVVLFGYIKFFGMPGRIGQIVISALCILIVGMYVVRAGHTKHMRRVEIDEMKEEAARLRRERFSDEDTYEAIEAYAEALFDYEEWQARRKPAYWKDISDSDARETVYSLYDMLGYEPDGTYDEYLDFTAELEEGTVGVMCPGSKKLTLKMAEGFAVDLMNSGLKKGIIYCTGQVDSSAREFCAGGSSIMNNLIIELCELSDVTKLVETVDHD